jgi:hypothetical protein
MGRRTNSRLLALLACIASIRRADDGPNTLLCYCSGHPRQPRKRQLAILPRPNASNTGTPLNRGTTHAPENHKNHCLVPQLPNYTPRPLGTAKSLMWTPLRSAISLMDTIRYHDAANTRASHSARCGRRPSGSWGPRTAAHTPLPHSSQSTRSDPASCSLPASSACPPRPPPPPPLAAWA